MVPQQPPHLTKIIYMGLTTPQPALSPIRFTSSRSAAAIRCTFAYAPAHAHLAFRGCRPPQDASTSDDRNCRPPARTPATTAAAYRNCGAPPSQQLRDENSTLLTIMKQQKIGTANLEHKVEMLKTLQASTIAEEESILSRS